MVICGVSISPDIFEELKTERVRDSKQITPRRREELDKLLRNKAEKFEIVEFEPQEIDRQRKNKTNLNEIEAKGFAQILNKLNPSKAYIDSASANTEKFTKNLQNLLKKNTELIVEHKADKNYLPVSAASIIAKVRRDKRIEALKEKYGETGSGYPADKYTIQFLKKWIKKHHCLPDFARKTWKTAKRIKTEAEK